MLLYINSNSQIEIELYKQLKFYRNEISNFWVKNIYADALLNEYSSAPIDTLLYSFLDYTQYSNLQSFQEEVDKVAQLIEFAQEKNIKNIILISHPSVYINSINLYSKHKAMIEELIIKSGIYYTILSIQTLTDFEHQCHSLDNLYYQKNESIYLIPKKQHQLIFSIEINNLVKIIQNINPITYNKKYDVMDSIYSLEDYLQLVNPLCKYVRRYPVYLHMLSFLGNYMSPTLLDLQLNPIVIMYNSKIKKDLQIELKQITQNDYLQYEATLNTVNGYSLSL